MYNNLRSIVNSSLTHIYKDVMIIIRILVATMINLVIGPLLIISIWNALFYNQNMMKEFFSLVESDIQGDGTWLSMMNRIEVNHWLIVETCVKGCILRVIYGFFLHKFLHTIKNLQHHVHLRGYHWINILFHQCKHHFNFLDCSDNPDQQLQEDNQQSSIFEDLGLQGNYGLILSHAIYSIFCYVYVIFTLIFLPWVLGKLCHHLYHTWMLSNVFPWIYTLVIESCHALWTFLQFNIQWNLIFNSWMTPLERWMDSLVVYSQYAVMLIFDLSYRFLTHSHVNFYIFMLKPTVIGMMVGMIIILSCLRLTAPRHPLRLLVQYGFMRFIYHYLYFLILGSFLINLVVFNLSSSTINSNNIPTSNESTSKYAAFIPFIFHLCIMLVNHLVYASQFFLCYYVGRLFVQFVLYVARRLEFYLELEHHQGWQLIMHPPAEFDQRIHQLVNTPLKTLIQYYSYFRIVLLMLAICWVALPLSLCLHFIAHYFWPPFTFPSNDDPSHTSSSYCLIIIYMIIKIVFAVTSSTQPFKQWWSQYMIDPVLWINVQLWRIQTSPHTCIMLRKIGCVLTCIISLSLMPFFILITSNCMTQVSIWLSSVTPLPHHLPYQPVLISLFLSFPLIRIVCVYGRLLWLGIQAYMRHRQSFVEPSSSTEKISNDHIVVPDIDLSDFTSDDVSSLWNYGKTWLLTTSVLLLQYGLLPVMMGCMARYILQRLPWFTLSHTLWPYSLDEYVYGSCICKYSLIICSGVFNFGGEQDNIQKQYQNMSLDQWVDRQSYASLCRIILFNVVWICVTFYTANNIGHYGHSLYTIYSQHTRLHQLPFSIGLSFNINDLCMIMLCAGLLWYVIRRVRQFTIVDVQIQNFERKKSLGYHS